MVAEGIYMYIIEPKKRGFERRSVDSHPLNKNLCTFFLLSLCYPGLERRWLYIMSISPLQILLAFAVCIALAWAAGKDYYKILNVQKSASAADIKRAYRKLSLKYHPDKNPSPDAAQKFSEIAQAYDVLSDPEKREVYNRGGEEAVKQQEQR